MFANTLPRGTLEVIKKLKSVESIRDFYLGGGTALALQLGHRESEDLDFFTQKDFEPQKLQIQLERIGKLGNVELAKGTLNCFLDDIKLQFLHYPYPLLENKIEWEGIYLSSALDIACTKLITVSVRGSKKDFVDVYFLLQKYELPFLLRKLEKKYKKVDYNLPSILKSLVYFEDAEGQPMPRMHKKVVWEKVKHDVVASVKNYKI